MTEAPEAVAAAELACLDGRIQPAAEAAIPVTDEGFLRGDGVFEVVRVYAGTPYALDEHLERMGRSLANLRLGYPLPQAEIEREAAELLSARGEGFDGVLRIVLTNGGHRLLLTEPLRDRPESLSIAFVTHSPTPVLEGVKSLSYAAHMLATRIAQERGFDEALLVTPHGRVLEAPTASLFWVAEDGALCTTPLSERVLASITRERLMQLVGVKERAVTTDELPRASEAFLASTVREVHPIRRIEDVELEAPGPRTREAEQAFAAHLRAVLPRPPL